MQNEKGSRRSLVAVGLVSAMLAMPLSHAAAEHRQYSPPRAPYAAPEQEEPSSLANWFGAALVAGMLYCALTGCIGGGSSGGGTSRRGKEEEPTQKPAYARPDSSAGCGWGDRAFGTCR